MKRFFVATLSVIAASACGKSPFAISPADVRFAVDRDSYLALAQHTAPALARYEFRVVARLENASATTLYLPRCYPDSRVPLYAVPLADEQSPHSSAYNPVWACVGHDHPIALPSRATRVDTLRVVGPTAVQHGTNIPIGKLEGDFALVLSVSSCPPDATDCPSASALTLRRRFRVLLER